MRQQQQFQFIKKTLKGMVKGLPAVVARRMMQSAVAESSSLPLVARSVSSAQSALNATASEGADLLFLDPTEVGDDAAGAFVKAVCELVSIPVFIDVLRINGVPEQSPGLELLKSGANGLVLTAIALEKAANGDAHHYVSALMSAVDLAVQQHKEVEPTNSPDSQVRVSFLQDVTDADGGLHQGAQTITAPSIEVEEPIEAQAKRIVEEERILLTEMVDLVRDASPEMEEVSLLIDAVKQLDEPFLLVIVGEYNSGKSSVINALLGKKFLKEGVLPTTNEITLLRHAGEGGETQERSERHPDGHFLRFLPADLLKQMNLVDTPGTNVILQRQQRLTEEFVPRADLVLFVLSADRPLTDSEVRFLRYIRQWGKKIIFILNKCDILSNSRQLGEVSTFVSENAQRLLSVEQAQVYPVSARQALHAKLSATLDDGVIDPDLLSKNSLWTTSGFGDLEGFILGFMGGSIDTGAERLRLKLETPLGIGVALLGACERQLVAEALKAEADLKALGSMELQLQRYEESMQNDAVSLCQRTLAVIEGAKGRTNKFIDSTLRLSNVEAVAKYLIGSDRPRSMPVSSHFEGEVLHTAVADVRKALEEHKAWIASNSERQLHNYWDFVSSRWPPEGEKDAQGAQSMREQPSMIQLHNLKKNIEGYNDSLTVLEGFDTKAAMILLEQELKEVVLSTFGGLGAAGLSASVLTSILPTTVEDLVALGICSAGGFVGVWNLPLRRADIKKKVKRVADSLTRQFQEAMQKELQESIDMVKAEVEALTRPYHKAAEEEVSRISGLKTELQRINAQLQVLRQRVQNLGT
ncbi:hypothetical protein CY35_09G066500 [Sphagnum magellanicum]|nr:hypothetical protein CY35_09G066500 [Sphagnum magellanicum]